ncbi:MAG: ATP-dependent metallopeptidase FtsH/Yme1/Tma family protein [Coprococcus sp.]
MDTKKKRLKIFFIYLFVLVLVAGIICIWALNRDKSIKIPYTTFEEYLENNQIKEAVIQEENVYFILKDDIDTQYVTDNPDYDRFKEQLLIHGVDVTVESAGADIFYIAMDIIFDLIFVAMLVGAVWFVVFKIGRQFKVIRHVDASFDDIAGMDRLKADMKQLVGLLKNPDEYKSQGIRQPKGVLLVGPPGNGKTLFARALAGEANMNFIATKATDFQSMYMSIGPAKIKRLFKTARKSKPCIIFIDEFDGIGEARNYAGQAIDKENNRMITALLNELDGFEQNGSGILVIGATNNIANLDPALIRAGRFDRKYKIDNPDITTINQLVDMYMGSRKLADNISKDKLAEFLKGKSCAQIEAVINEALMEVDRREGNEITEADINAAIKVINI